MLQLSLVQKNSFQESRAGTGRAIGGLKHFLSHYAFSLFRLESFMAVGNDYSSSISNLEHFEAEIQVCEQFLSREYPIGKELGLPCRAHGETGREKNSKGPLHAHDDEEARRAESHESRRAVIDRSGSFVERD